jgi:pimeloyl-ACP methyl ester carboxylesterase/DNA-binding CsgD family transcriptional regulator
VALTHDIEAVFSLLSQPYALTAARDALGAAAHAGLDGASAVTWAEFDVRGRYRRGGRTCLSALATDLEASPIRDPEILTLIEHARAHGPGPGRLDLLDPGDRCAWYVPFTAVDRHRQPETRIRGVLLTRELFVTVIRALGDGRLLTQAELHVAFQTVAGLTPQAAAARDGVSVETRRSQLKSLCAKLGCRGQSDVVRKLLGQLAYLPALSDADGVFARTAERFAEHYLAADGHLATRRLRDGRLMRYLDCGPMDGTPVVMLHGMMWPILVAGCWPHLQANGLRLIVPIRRGHLQPALGGTPTNPAEALADASLDDIAAFVSETVSRPVVLLGNSLGAVLAAAFANRHPNLVQRLILLSTNLTQPPAVQGGPAAQFYASLNRLSPRRDLVNAITETYKSYYAELDSCRHILDTLFGASASDLEVLRGHRGRPAQYAMFADLYKDSTAGMADDYIFVMQSGRRVMSALRHAPAIIHGRDDPLTRPAQLTAALPADLQRDALELPGGGHFIAASHPGAVWAEVARQARHPAGPARPRDARLA